MTTEPAPASPSPDESLILYQTPDGRIKIDCRVLHDTIWLSQAQIGEVFGRSKQTISEHLRNVFEEGELDEHSVVRNFRTTAADGKTYDVTHYNLEAILAVGFRVKSPRGTQFRKWANTQLKEFLTKGFVMDDERLKNPNGWDYFDELLARIREIRASEKRFYQKVRDLFALSADYRADDTAAREFFATVQNKLLFAVTGKTAAEIIVSRADPAVPNMALTSWAGSRVRRADVVVAKNYLTADEVDILNRLVVIFLDQAELRAKGRHDLTLAFWQANVDRLLEFNERPILTHAGKVSAEEAQRIADDRYAHFDAARRYAEAAEADAEDLKAIEDLDHNLRGNDSQQRSKDPEP